MTVEELNKWCKENRIYMGRGDQYVINYIECEDGFNFTLGASEWNECHPRNCHGPWTHLEVGFFSDDTHYIDMKDQKLKGYVPVELIVAEVNLHGGIRKDRVLSGQNYVVS